MNWTPEQQRVLDHPLDAHAVIRAAPGAGKTTLLVARVKRLLALGADSSRIRVVMFNKSIQETFEARLGREGTASLVSVTTFDALGLEVIKAAQGRRLLSKPLLVESTLTTQLSRSVFASHQRGYGDNDFEEPEDIERAVGFWKNHLVPPARAAFPTDPKIVTAYREFEALRSAGPALRIGFEDMVYTAVALLRAYPDLMGTVDHLLVDEFQDVNPGRVELMQRLMNPGTSLMVVGDEDQGINEWCGANTRYFLKFGETFTTRPIHEYRLSRTFRFGPELATAATRLIQKNVERTPGVIVGTGGSTRIHRVSDLVTPLRALLASGIPPTDLAVLYRGRAQGAATIATLIAAGVPLDTEDSMLFRAGPGPKLALAMLKAAAGHDPVDPETAWLLAYAPDRFLKKGPFMEQVAKHGARGFRNLCRAGHWDQPRDTRLALRDLAARLDRMAGCRTAAEALRIMWTGLRDQVAGKLPSVNAKNNALHGLDALLAFLERVAVPPAGAAAAMAAIDPKRGLPVSACVRASTIHQAKGLEWKHVFLPNVLEDLCPAQQVGKTLGTVETPDGIQQSPWMEQERRIFYVGVTRAIESCTIQAPPDDATSRFVAELLGGGGGGSPLPRPERSIPERLQRAMFARA